MRFRSIRVGAVFPPPQNRAGHGRRAWSGTRMKIRPLHPGPPSIRVGGHTCVAWRCRSRKTGYTENDLTRIYRGIAALEPVVWASETDIDAMASG